MQLIKVRGEGGAGAGAGADADDTVVGTSDLWYPLHQVVNPRAPPAQPEELVDEVTYDPPALGLGLQEGVETPLESPLGGLAATRSTPAGGSPPGRSPLPRIRTGGQGGAGAGGGDIAVVVVVMVVVEVVLMVLAVLDVMIVDFFG